jgi:type III secretion protein F
MPVTFDSIGSTLNRISQSTEDSLQAKLEEIGNKENPSTQDLLEFQQLMQQWSVSVQMNSTMIKELGDALKGIIQKAS